MQNQFSAFHGCQNVLLEKLVGVSPPQKKISKKSSSGVVATTDACENGHIACPSCCTKMKRKSRSGRDVCPCPFCDMEIGSKIGSRRNRCRCLEKFIKSINTLKTSFKYQLTAKSMDTCLDMKSVPEVYTECSKLTSEKDYLTVPFEFAGYNALLSLDVCIKKISISSEFDEEVEQVAGEALGNDDDDNPLGSLQVVLTDPGALDCSNCQEPLTTPIYKKGGTLEPEENTFFHISGGKQAFIEAGEGQELLKPLQEPGNKYLKICFRNRSFGLDAVHVAAPVFSIRLKAAQLQKAHCTWESLDVMLHKVVRKDTTQRHLLRA
ncbi:hypothetical protein Tco_1490374 [Tanacetum coccineum]